jgi:S-adenosylmethionine:tRNA ribosyltransferase-isomerase
VKTENALEHPMHQEQIVVTRKTIENLLNPDRFTVAVGTTSLRTLESLYWYGVKLLTNPNAEFAVSQQDPYANADDHSPSREKVLQAILARMDSQSLANLTGNTSIFIYPGYQFRICNGLITNFHLPASRLSCSWPPSLETTGEKFMKKHSGTTIAFSAMAIAPS